MGRRKATELGRLNALCREHGVTYGQGVAMGLKFPVEQVYEPAKAAGILVVERSAAGEQTKIPLVGLCEECNPGVSGVEGTAIRNT